MFKLDWNLSIESILHNNRLSAGWTTFTKEWSRWSWKEQATLSHSLLLYAARIQLLLMARPMVLPAATQTDSGNSSCHSANAAPAHGWDQGLLRADADVVRDNGFDSETALGSPVWQENRSPAERGVGGVVAISQLQPHQPHIFKVYFIAKLADLPRVLNNIPFMQRESGRGI